MFKPLTQGSRRTDHPGLKTTPLRGCVPALPRETGEVNRLFSTKNQALHIAPENSTGDAFVDYPVVT